MYNNIFKHSYIGSSNKGDQFVSKVKKADRRIYVSQQKVRRRLWFLAPNEFLMTEIFYSCIDLTVDALNFFYFLQEMF